MTCQVRISNSPTAEELKDLNFLEPAGGGSDSPKALASAALRLLPGACKLGRDEHVLKAA